MNIDKATQNAIDRLYPDTADPTAPVQQSMYDCRAQLADAEAVYREMLDAVGRCDADIHAPDDAAQQLAALEAKRTDILAAGYIKRLVTNTTKLDSDIKSAEQRIADLRVRARGAASARPQLLSQMITARTVVEGLQQELARLNRVLTGRPPTAAETEAYERDVFAQQVRRRIEGSPENTLRRREEQGREQRIAAEKARQLRQRTLKDGPVP